MKNFLRAFTASNRDDSKVQNQPESIDLSEQELESANGGDHHHHDHDHDYHRRDHDRRDHDRRDHDHRRH